MRLNDDGKTVAAAGVHVPKIGEIIGGSDCQKHLSVLDTRIKEVTGHDPAASRGQRATTPPTTPPSMAGTAACAGTGPCRMPHAGFGCGVIRPVRFVADIVNIRCVMPFPCWPSNACF
ncbi:asparaginyl-tRNA synthetase [Achlya hypogyna]|uniref:Asparaginyl-tRNA synthetase n=1 Tax=Achlya hypogyna TaxID=1202772 RepID=A0A1V9YV11_ACHHY|nr:asparaginyl-tRNA synthetase [Achlya hypogyna]